MRYALQELETDLEWLERTRRGCTGTPNSDILKLQAPRRALLPVQM